MAEDSLMAEDAPVTAPALEIRDYALSFRTPSGPFRVLDGVDLTIRRGEVVALVGESGSGKSTLAHAVMRSIESPAAESGAVRLAGEDLLALPEHRLARLRGNRVAMVFQDPGGSLNPTLPLGAHVVEVLARHRGMARGAALAETRRLFDMVGLPDPDLMAEKYPHEVSGGEKQRVVIAMAFACDPDLILFDEATTALDATTAVNILDLFRDLQERTGVAALFISHDLGTVAEIAHRVAVIYGGRIVEDAPVGQLFHEPRHPYTRALLACLPRPAEAGRQATLFTLPGPLPDRIGPPRPCIFEDRCPFVTDACRDGPVPLAGETHRTACIRWRDVLPLPLRDVAAADVAASGTATPAPVMTVRDLAVSIGRPSLLDRLLGREPRIVRAVTGVSFDLHPGRTLGLVGESGCGKSSLARALVGLRPFTGKVRFEERTIGGPGDMDRRYRGRVQIIFQNPDSSLNPRHTVATILGRPLRLHRGLSGRALHDAVADLLAQVKLPSEHAGRHPHQLSGGEKQRVAIARAIAAEPAVVICDEITSGLDASVQAAIVNLLREIQARLDIAFLFITHDLNLLRYVADRVAVMYLGAFAEMRDGDGIAAPPYHPYTEALLSSAPTLDPDLHARRIRLAGSLPTRTDALLGCTFESRCPRRIDDRCALQRPPVRRFGGRAEPDRHWLTCHIRAPELAAFPPIWRATGDPDPTETGDTRS